MVNSIASFLFDLSVRISLNQSRVLHFQGKMKQGDLTAFFLYLVVGVFYVTVLVVVEHAR